MKYIKLFENFNDKIYNYKLIKNALSVNNLKLNKEYSSYEVLKYFKSLEETAISDKPDYYYDLIKKSNKRYKLEIVNINDIIESDVDVKDYVDSDSQRYDDDDYEIDEITLHNPIILFDESNFSYQKDQMYVIDGYNRLLTLFNSGYDYTTAFIPIKN